MITFLNLASLGSINTVKCQSITKKGAIFAKCLGNFLWIHLKMKTVRTNETSRDFYSKIHVGEHATTAERIVNITNSVQNLISNMYNSKI